MLASAGIFPSQDYRGNPCWCCSKQGPLKIFGIHGIRRRVLGVSIGDYAGNPLGNSHAAFFHKTVAHNKLFFGIGMCNKGPRLYGVWGGGTSEM